MSEIKTFDRWVKDPLFSPVKRFLEKRKAIVNQTGDIVDRQLAEFRYDQLQVDDFIIEQVLVSPDGAKRICMTNRNKHFARVDMPLTEVSLRECFSDLGVPVVTVLTHEDFINGFKIGGVQNRVLYLAWRDCLAVCLSDKKAHDLTGVNEVFQDTFFESMTLYRESAEYIDKNTLISGEIEVTDHAIGSEKLQLYISDLISSELGIVDMQHNFPSNITSQRGNEIRHNIKVFTNGEDISNKATYTYTTKNRNVHVSTTANKLEMIVDVIRGDTTTELDDIIYVRVQYHEDLTQIDVVVEITVKILKDTVSQLKLYGYPTTIQTPDDVELAVVIKASLDGVDVTPSIVPSQLLGMVYGTSLAARGASDGGTLFSGICKVGVQNGEYRDLLQGTFRYTVGSVTHTATAFIELTVTPAIAGYGKLILVNIQPTSLIGNPGVTRQFNYVVKRLGQVITNDKLKFPIGTPLGPKRLIRFNSVTPTDVNYEFLRDIGDPGALIKDTVRFDVSYTDEDAVVWRITSEVYPESRTPSEITYVPRGESTPILAKRYDAGRMPFDILVNGVPSNQLYTLETINSINNVIQLDLDGFQSETRAWMYLGRLDEDIPNTPVEFVGLIHVDGVYMTTRYTKKFNLIKFTGPAWVAVPDTISVAGPENDIGLWQTCIWNENIRVNQEVEFNRALSTMSNKTDVIVNERTPRYLKATQLFRGFGDWTDVLAFGKPGANSATVAKVTINSQVARPKGLSATVGTINTWEPYKNNSLALSVKFDGEIVPLFDSKVRTSIVFVGENQANYVKMPVEAYKLVYYVKREAAFTSTVINFELEVTYTHTDGQVYTKFLTGVIDLKRSAFTKLTIIPEADPILPVKVDQRVWFRISDGTQFLGGARITDIKLNPVDQFRNPLKSYKPTMGYLSNDLSRYFFTVTTNHIGGDFWADTQVGIGDAMFKAVSEEYFEIPVTEIIGTNVSDGLGIANTTSTITFDLNQAQLDDPNTPVVMNSFRALRGDQFYFNSVTELKMLSPGKYSAKVESTGEKGKGSIGFVMIKFDGDPGFEQEWECNIDIEMK